jgi:hypothetical protein
MITLAQSHLPEIYLPEVAPFRITAPDESIRLCGGCREVIGPFPYSLWMSDI